MRNNKREQIEKEIERKFSKKDKQKKVKMKVSGRSVRELKKIISHSR